MHGQILLLDESYEIDLGQVQLSLFEHEIKSISQHKLNGTDDLRRLCSLNIW